MPLLSPSELRRAVNRTPAISAVRQALGDDIQAPLFVVGGAVRDLMLGRAPVDVDLATEGDLAALLARLHGPVESHERFTTATVSVAGTRCDIAQTRAESYAAPGALPDVRPATIREDLERRDFTVNALAFTLTGPLAGELITVDGALADLEAGRLAVLHAQSFVDDPTRLLRLARYAARLRFSVAPQTRALAATAIDAGALATVSGARIGNELRLLSKERDPIAAMAALTDLHADCGIDPVFNFTPERQQLAQAALRELPADGRPDLLLLAVALLGVGRPSLITLLDRLEFTASDRDVVVEAATGSRALAAALAGAESGSQIAHAVGGAGVVTVALAAAHGEPTRAQRWLNELRHRALLIRGTDLMALGIPEGPQLGRGLQAARDAMWDGSAMDRESQLNAAVA